MKKPLLFFTVAIIASLVANLLSTRASLYGKRYPPSKYEVMAEGITEDGMALLVKIAEGENHHCPGADYRIVGQDIRFTLVRSRRGEVATAMVAPRKNESGTFSFVFPFPGGKMPLTGKVTLVDDRADKRFGSWTAAPDHAADHSHPSS